MGQMCRKRVSRCSPNFKRWQHIVARKDKMNFTNAGAVKRHTISPRKSSAGKDPMERHMAFSDVLSTRELRQLVAAMVD